MDRRALIALVVLLVTAGSANAVYVTPATPAGLTAGGSDFAGLMAKPSALAGDFVGGIVRSPNGPVVGGNKLSMGLKLAGNAGKFVGRAMFLSPTGLGLAAITWAASECVERKDGKWVLTCGPTLPPQSTGKEYRHNNKSSQLDPWYPTADEACQSAHSLVAGTYFYPPSNWNMGGTTVSGVGTCNTTGTHKTEGFVRNQTTYYSERNSSCPVGWYQTSGGCVQTVPFPELDQQAMEDKLANKPLPNGIDWTGWGSPTVPVGEITLNPTAGNNPVSQPLRVPQGNPVPRPNTDPQLYDQPVTRITHAPTTGNPLRTDVTGETVTGTNPTGLTGPTPVTTESPTGTPKEEPPPDLCEKNPDIVACQKLGNLEAQPVPNENKALTITPDGGWGQSNASCPADRSASLSFGPISFSYQPICLFATGIRPFVIALAWLSSAMIFFGMARRD